MAIKVSLRGKHITKGRKSLYLDFYPAIAHPETGKLTRREYLGLYITDDVQTKDIESLDTSGKKYIKTTTIKDRYKKPKKKILNAFEKKGNKEVLSIAEGIRQKRHSILNKPEVYTEHEKQLLKKNKIGDLSFIEYYESISEKAKGKNYEVWKTTCKYLIRFSDGQDIKFKDVSKALCEDYREYLLTTSSLRSDKSKLSQNSAHSYFNKFKAVLKRAFVEERIEKDLNTKVKPIEQLEVKKDFLTLEELNLLANAECPNPILKRASLFSALTGLRYSDIEKLTWGEVINDKKQYSIYFSQQKTDSVESLPISQQAYKLLGEPKEKGEKVFDGLKYSTVKPHLLRWLMKAGISKDLSFHSLRHTYAVLQLKNGTDLYTVSKMLGHKDIRTTQVYAKVVSESKRATIDKIQITYEPKDK